MREAHDPREAPWTTDLYAIVEDLHAYMITREAVGAMHEGVDKPLEPDVFGNKGHRPETPF